VNDAEYKVMGLAPYGKPRYVDRLRALIDSQPGGQYRLDMRYFDFLGGKRMYSEAWKPFLDRQPVNRRAR